MMCNNMKFAVFCSSAQQRAAALASTIVTQGTGAYFSKMILMVRIIRGRLNQRED